MKHTICGVDSTLFLHPPTPKEIGALVAMWDSDKQAEFLFELGEQIRFSCNGKAPFQYQFVADRIMELEKELLDGSAREFIHEIATRLEETETRK